MIIGKCCCYLIVTILKKVYYKFSMITHFSARPNLSTISASSLSKSAMPLTAFIFKYHLLIYGLFAPRSSSFLRVRARMVLISQ